MFVKDHYALSCLVKFSHLHALEVIACHVLKKLASSALDLCKDHLSVWDIVYLHLCFRVQDFAYVFLRVDLRFVVLDIMIALT